MRNVLVTGGTGFIGLELVRQLSAAGIRPRLLVRRPHRAALLASLDVDWVQGDLAAPSTLERAVDGVDTVFHLGGRASFETYRRLKPSIVDGTGALASLAAAAGARHFVFASSLLVYDDQTAPIDASTPSEPALGYGRAKLEAESILARVGSETGMSVASVRLPHVYGPRSALFEQIRGGLVIFPGPMSNRCGQLHVDDAARVLVEMGKQRWSGTSAVADQDSVSWIDFFAIVKALYPDFRLVRLPRWLSYAGAAVVEPPLSLRNAPTLYTKGTVVGFNLDLPVSPALVWSDLDLAPRFPTVREGIAAALDGYIHFRWRHPLLDRRGT